MKIDRTVLTMSASLILLAFASQATAQGTNSIEFMCKAKAKEIAAETYKGCVTENKQVQVKRIRNEYQTKLAELKNQYNSELKQLSPKKSGKVSNVVDTNASEMPAKKMKSSRIKSEKIDLSTVGDQDDSGGEVASPETEIVEIPVQQE
ncbi:MAG: hypothetical protein H7235_12390 [Bdellovibrionaceae bacterium]|nr:hypothetical protein [Pseudobdellovibrionaceae bacterium]